MIMILYSIFALYLSMFFLLLSLLMKLTLINLMIEWMIFSLNSLMFQISVFLDWISLIFISTVLFISSMIMIYSMIYMEKNYNIHKFSWMVILFILSMIFMIISPNLFMIIIGWDLLGLISFCLVIFYQNYNSFNSGMITILSNRIGDISLIMIISLLSFNSNWNLFINFNKNNIFMFIILMIMICSMTKSAQFPFSSWLPKAMAAPTPISALVHSSTLVTAGIFIMIRYNNILLYFKLNKFMMFISSMTMFMAGINAFFEKDFKKIIAMSTLSQLSFMFIMLSFNNIILTFFHLLTHAIFKSLMFMCSGSMIHNMMNSQDIRSYGNFSKISPWTNLIFSFSSMALCGIFFLSGFYSKDLIIENIYMLNINISFLFLLLTSTMLTFMYSTRLIFYINFKTPKMYSLIFFHNNYIMNFSMIISFILTICFGSFLSWIFFDKNNLIFINNLMKLLILFLIPLSFFFSYLMFKIEKKNIFFFYFMWFIDLIIKKIYINKIILLKNLYINLNKGWIEIYSKFLLTYIFKEFIKNFNLKYTPLFMIFFIIILSLF